MLPKFAHKQYIYINKGQSLGKRCTQMIFCLFFGWLVLNRGGKRERFQKQGVMAPTQFLLLMCGWKVTQVRHVFFSVSFLLSFLDYLLSNYQYHESFRTLSLIFFTKVLFGTQYNLKMKLSQLALLYTSF